MNNTAISSLLIVTALGFLALSYTQFQPTPSKITSTKTDKTTAETKTIKQNGSSSVSLDIEIKKLQQEIRKMAEQKGDIEARLSDLEFSYINIIEKELLSHSSQTEKSNPDFIEPTDKTYDQDYLDQFIAQVDSAISSNQTDPEATEIAFNQLEHVMQNIPGITVDDVHCESSTCRAALTQADNASMDLAKLVDKPPFLGDLYTTQKDDGSVLLYFSRN